MIYSGVLTQGREEPIQIPLVLCDFLFVFLVLFFLNLSQDLLIHCR